MNETQRTQLKNQIDLLSDAHRDITGKAVEVNINLLKTDDALASGRSNSLYGRFADRGFCDLIDLLEAHARRAERVRAEIEQIRKNIKN